MNKNIFNNKGVEFWNVTLKFSFKVFADSSLKLISVHFCKLTSPQLRVET